MNNRILNAIQGRSSTNPVSLDELQSKLGTTQEPLLETLETMYETAQISRAYISKMVNNELKPMLYVWPTGILKPFNLATDYKISAPRRDEIQPAKKLNDVTPQQGDKASNKELNMTKPRTLQILEHIEANPGCPYVDFMNALKIEGASGYIGNHIDRGDVIKTQVKPRKNIYFLKQGKTAVEIYNGGVTNNGKNLQAIKEVREIAQEIRQQIENGTPASNPDNAQSLVEKLLEIIPAGYELTISKRDKTILEIAGGVLDDAYTVKLENINDSIAALETLNNLMQA